MLPVARGVQSRLTLSVVLGAGAMTSTSVRSLFALRAKTRWVLLVTGKAVNVASPELLLAFVETTDQTFAGPSLYKVIGNEPLGKFAVMEMLSPATNVVGDSVREPVWGPLGRMTSGGSGVSALISVRPSSGVVAARA